MEWQRVGSWKRKPLSSPEQAVCVQVLPHSSSLGSNDSPDDGPWRRTGLQAFPASRAVPPMCRQRSGLLDFGALLVRQRSDWPSGAGVEVDPPVMRVSRVMGCYFGAGDYVYCIQYSVKRNFVSDRTFGEIMPGEPLLDLPIGGCKAVLRDGSPIGIRVKRCGQDGCGLRTLGYDPLGVAHQVRIREVGRTDDPGSGRVGFCTRLDRLWACAIISSPRGFLS